MAVERDAFEEKPGSPLVTRVGTRLERRFWLSGTTDYYTALARVALNTELEINTLPRRDIELDPAPNGVEGLWDVLVVYDREATPGSVNNEPSEIGDERTSYSTRGGTVLLRQALEHLGTYPESTEEEPIPQHDGAINVTNEGVEGVEIEVPGWTMIIEKILDANDVNAEFIRGAYSASQTVNQNEWRGYEPGELRLVSVDLNPINDETYRGVYEFTGQANLDNATIGHVTGIEKPGQAYVWTEHEKIVDGDVTRQKLLAVHVERVYPRSDFASLLGLPG